MHKTILAVIIIAIMATYSHSYAEMYQGIGPLDSMGDVKAKFPNAKFVKENLAWATETDAVYRVSGQGLVGDLLINFYDPRPNYKRYALETSDPDEKEAHKKFADQTDNEALSVQWVRWIPDLPIPLDRVISKYGKPDKKDFSPELVPMRLWTKKAMIAALADDEKKVIFIQFGFTRDDLRKAWMEKQGVVPSYLKDKEPTKSQKKK